jgi:hypothetical protein
VDPGADPARRVTSRQLLPTYGVVAVGGLTLPAAPDSAAGVRGPYNRAGSHRVRETSSGKGCCACMC